ncbi:MAG: leucine-rich repeat domain-containing protein [Muribaculaceae bacterium]|nr:leucine-rich repeat domain-containing protein [Muribaculaceae bacterium]
MNRHIHILIALLLSVLAASCSEHSRPDYPEPSMEIAEASGITRTGAIVKAAIDRHGNSSLDYVTLRYHEVSADPGDELSIEADPSLSAFEFRLTDLRPGAGYSCHLEAGTMTASLKSNTITFTTIPNDPPAVSEVTPVSTGPLGIMVRFSITDDGGEPILEAGCEVKETGSTESRRIYATQTNPLPLYFQLSITGLSPATSYTITPFASNSRGESRGAPMEYTTSGSVILTQPGMLARLFDRDYISSMELLTIAGPMNGDDFRMLRQFLGAPGEDNTGFHASGIDLTDVSIVEGGASYDGRRFTVADCISTGLFAGCDSLRTAILPASAISMDRDAFAHCHALEHITVPAGVETVLPSSDCTSLKAIEVSEANPFFKSDQGVLLNSDASAILWFPLGKTGEYRFPPTISAIGENAFAGTSITTLIIPSAVTSISRGAFAGSALTEIRLPDNMTNISEGMFQNCSSLAIVRLGKATDYVGDYAFDGTSLTDLFVSADYPPFAASEAFTDRNGTLTGTCTLHVPAGTRKLYSSHRQWGTFSHIEEFQP